MQWFARPNDGPDYRTSLHLCEDSRKHSWDSHADIRVWSEHPWGVPEEAFDTLVSSDPDTPQGPRNRQSLSALTSHEWAPCISFHD